MRSLEFGLERKNRRPASMSRSAACIRTRTPSTPLRSSLVPLRRRRLRGQPALTASSCNRVNLGVWAPGHRCRLGGPWTKAELPNFSKCRGSRPRFEVGGCEHRPRLGCGAVPLLRLGAGGHQQHHAVDLRSARRAVVSQQLLLLLLPPPPPPPPPPPLHRPLLLLCCGLPTHFISSSSGFPDADRRSRDVPHPRLPRRLRQGGRTCRRSARESSRLRYESAARNLRGVRGAAISDYPSGQTSQGVACILGDFTPSE